MPHRLICTRIGVECAFATPPVWRTCDDRALTAAFGGPIALIAAHAFAGSQALPRFQAPPATGGSQPARRPLLTLASDLARYAHKRLGPARDAMIGLLAGARGPAPLARPALVIIRSTATEVLWHRKGWE